MASIKNIIKGGVWNQNPVLVQAIGLCPVLAVTTSMVNGFYMGLASTVVLLGSNIMISLVRKVVPAKVRIPIYITIIASFVTLVQLYVSAFQPALNDSLGIFIPLIVVNCVILGRAEAFASKNSVFKSIFDALAMGVGFTIALLMMSFVREFFGANQLFGLNVIPGFMPATIMILPAGGFLTMGVIIAIMNYLNRKKKSEE